jgi:hypothetical protein
VRACTHERVQAQACGVIKNIPEADESWVDSLLCTDALLGLVDLRPAVRNFFLPLDDFNDFPIEKSQSSAASARQAQGNGQTQAQANDSPADAARDSDGESQDENTPEQTMHSATTEGPQSAAHSRSSRSCTQNPDSLEQTAALARDEHGSEDGGIASADGSDCERSRGAQDHTDMCTADNADGCKAHAQANTLGPSALVLAENCADVLFPAENFVDSEEEDGGGVMEQFKCYMNKDLETIRRDVIHKADAEAQPTAAGQTTEQDDPAVRNGESAALELPEQKPTPDQDEAEARDDAQTTAGNEKQDEADAGDDAKTATGNDKQHEDQSKESGLAPGTQTNIVHCGLGSSDAAAAKACMHTCSTKAMRIFRMLSSWYCTCLLEILPA